MIDHVVVDVEIQKCVEDLPNGWDSTDLMGVACACLWEHAAGRMRIYGPDDVEALKARLLKADRITGYNIFRFDYPVIWGLAGRARVEALRDKTDDLLLRIWAALGLDLETFGEKHKGWGLGQVAPATLGGPGKIGYGGDAPKWFQAGQHARVINYCCDDVALERDLGLFMDRYVANEGIPGHVRIAPWEPGKFVGKVTK